MKKKDVFDYADDFKKWNHNKNTSDFAGFVLWLIHSPHNLEFLQKLNGLLEKKEEENWIFEKPLRE